MHEHLLSTMKESHFIIIIVTGRGHTVPPYGKKQDGKNNVIFMV